MVISLDLVLSLIFLIIIEIVLGIDNLIFLAILTERLPQPLKSKIRAIGLTGAWVLRLLKSQGTQKNLYGFIGFDYPNYVDGFGILIG